MPWYKMFLLVHIAEVVVERQPRLTGSYAVRSKVELQGEQDRRAA